MQYRFIFLRPNVESVKMASPGTVDTHQGCRSAGRRRRCHRRYRRLYLCDVTVSISGDVTAADALVVVLVVVSATVLDRAQFDPGRPLVGTARWRRCRRAHDAGGDRGSTSRVGVVLVCRVPFGGALLLLLCRRRCHLKSRRIVLGQRNRHSAGRRRHAQRRAGRTGRGLSYLYR